MMHKVFMKETNKNGLQTNKDPNFVAFFSLLKNSKGGIFVEFNLYRVLTIQIYACLTLTCHMREDSTHRGSPQ